jgi:hypothetical protein
MNAQQAPSHDAALAGHQADRVNARAIAWLTLGLAAVVAFTMVFLWQLLGRLSPQQPPSTAPPAGWALDNRPPSDSNQQAQLDALRQWEQKTLESYAWQDEEKTHARIPIDRAMTLLEQLETPPTPANESESNPGDAGQP